VTLFLQGQIQAIPPGGPAFVDVRDAAEAVALALTRGAAGQRYLLSGANWAWTRFYAELGRITGQNPPGLALPRFTRALMGWLPDFDRGTLGRLSPIGRGELMVASFYWFADEARARRELGWQPRDPLRTLEETVNGAARSSPDRG
jgi:dihydroflavonol-4-reductase